MVNHNYVCQKVEDKEISGLDGESLEIEFPCRRQGCRGVKGDFGVGQISKSRRDMECNPEGDGGGNMRDLNQEGLNGDMDKRDTAAGEEKPNRAVPQRMGDNDFYLIHE